MSATNLKKILYVDDEEINLQLFEMTYEGVYHIITADSGDKAIQKLKDNTDIALIITDMKMPGMDGIDFMKEAKKNSKDIPGIILSGYQRTEKILDALADGLITDYLMKPFGKKNLEHLIQKILLK